MFLNQRPNSPSTSTTSPSLCTNPDLVATTTVLSLAERSSTNTQSTIASSPSIDSRAASSTIEENCSRVPQL